MASCKDLIDSRFPADGDNGAAAMLLADGTILTGTAPDAVNASVEVCHEIEPYCGAYGALVGLAGWRGNRKLDKAANDSHRMNN